MRESQQASHRIDHGVSLYKMSDGTWLYGVAGSGAELRFIYDEIYVQRVYQRHGITIQDGDCLLDVGANVGLFTLFAARQAVKLRVLAFEPMPPTLMAFRENIRSNSTICEQRHHDIQLFDFGISNEHRQAEMTWYPTMPGNSTLYPAEKKREAEMIAQAFRMKDVWRFDKPAFSMLLLMYPFRRLAVRMLASQRFHRGRSLPVTLRSLNSVIAEEQLDRVDLLKVDVEGAELDVLASLSNEDWSRVMQLVVEVSPANVPKIPGLINELRIRGFGHNAVEEIQGGKQSAKRSQIPRTRTLYAVRK